MPLISDDGFAGFRSPLSRRPQPEEEAPGFLTTAGAAFRQENPITSLWRYMRDRAGFEDDPRFELSQLLPEIKGTVFESRYLDRFVGIGSRAEAQAVMRQIEQEEKDREILAASGAAGFVTAIGAGLIDPTILIPGTLFVKGGRAGWTATRLAAGAGIAGATAVGIQEGVLYSTQELRTPGEVAINVGAGTILSGLLGAGIGAWISRGDREVAERALAFDREAWARDLRGEGAAPGGAAVADTRTLQLQGFGLDRIPVVGSLITRISPTLRIFSGPFVTARRAMADLAETALRFTQNREGIPTTQGPTLDRMARLWVQRSRVAAGEEIDRLFSQYRFGRVDAGFARTQADKALATAQRVVGADAGKMTNLEFREAVGVAMRNADTHEIPEVAQAAQWVRENVFDPWKERAIKIGLLPEDVDVDTAASYFTRVYNRQAIVARRPEFQGRIADWLEAEQARKAGAQERIAAIVDDLEAQITKLADEKADLEDLIAAQVKADRLRARLEEEIVGWRGKSTADAMSAIRARTKAATEAGKDPEEAVGRSADKAVLAAARKIMGSDRNLTRAELDGRASEIVDRILGSPDGRLPYDAPSGGPKIGFTGEGSAPRGPLAARVFHIPDELIADFLDSDVENVMQTYLRTMVPDVLLAERFGDVDMTDAFKKIREEHARLSAAATSEKARVRLQRRYEATVRDLAAARDRIRNVYAFRPDMRNTARATMAVKLWQVLSDLGGVILTSLPDSAGPIFVNGFTRVLRSAYIPFFRSVKRIAGKESGYAEAKRQYRAMGIVIETRLAARTNDAYELVDAYRPGSRFERGLHALTEKSMLITGLAPWTDFGKTIAATTSGNEIFRAARLAASGKLTAKLRERLAASGIDEEMAKRIWAQFENGGETVDGVHLPNTADWTDRAARDAFEGAVAREADIAIITPGQEKPLWLSRPVASVLGQFKTFAAAATERLLIGGLQRHDAETLSGLIAGITAGMLSYVAYRVATGQEISEDPAVWVKEGISRSGILGWFEEGNAFLSKITAGQMDIYRPLTQAPSTRYAARSAIGQLLGPTFGKVENLLSASGAAWSGTWTAADTRNMRRMLAFQNLFYIRQLLDQVEAGINAGLGVPERRR